MIGVSFVVTIEGDLPFVAIALDEISDPLLLLWREWSVPALIFIVELHAVQITGEALAREKPAAHTTTLRLSYQRH